MQNNILSASSRTVLITDNNSKNNYTIAGDIHLEALLTRYYF